MAFDTEIGADDCDLMIDNVWRAGASGEWSPILNRVDESLIGRRAVAQVPL